MSNVKSKASYRLLAAFLSFVMVFLMIPFSMVAHAATTEYPDSFTVSVKDEEGNPLTDGKVVLTRSNDAWELYLEADIDENGLAVFDSAAIQTAYQTAVEAGTISEDNGVLAKTYAKVSGYTFGDKSVWFNSSTDGSFTQHIELTLKKNLADIEDVEIIGKTLTYTGKEQKLVSVTEVEGDTVTYAVDGGEPTTTVPVATDVCSKQITVTVSRDGHKDKVATVTGSIVAADITDITITPVTGLKYNKTEQALVTVQGIAIGDKITWTVGNNTADPYIVDESNIGYVPTATNAGEYKITLKIERNDNYKIYESEEQTTVIVATNIDGLSAELSSGLVYNANDQELVKKDATTGEYITGLDDGDEVYYIVGTDADAVATSDAWVKWTEDSKPTGKNADDYTVRIKVVRTNYNDTEIELDPTTVTISKADQEFTFDVNHPATDDVDKAVLEAGKTYDFSATDTNNYVGIPFVYGIQISTDSQSDCATIDTDTGIVTFVKPGKVTVTATLPGNANYNSKTETKEITVNMLSNNGDLIEFVEPEIEYVLGENNGVASTNKATPKKNFYLGDITHSIDDAATFGLKCSGDGVVEVINYNTLIAKMQENGGTLNVTVNAKKVAFGGYAVDTISYTLTIKFNDISAISEPYTLPEDQKNSNGWYKDNVIVTPATGYEIAESSVSVGADNFKSEVTFGDNGDQGTADRFVYLKDKTTGGISDKIKVSVKIDTENPTDVKIKYAKSPTDTFLEIITLGFYKPSVTVRFTAYDATSGIESFAWSYTKDASSSDINHRPTDDDAKKAEQILDAEPVEGVPNTYFAEMTLTATQAEQYRGYLTVVATDVASSATKKIDNGNVFVIDTVSPTIRVEYSESSGNKESTRYYKNDINVVLTITEANFYSEDVEVTVTKDGVEFNDFEVVWGPKNANDENVGTFKLAAPANHSKDGVYNVSVKYSDRSETPEATYTSNDLIIDTTAPIVEVEPSNKDNQTIKIVVTEQNFFASDINVNVEASLKAGTVTAKDIQTFARNDANWAHNGNVHTLVLGSDDGSNNMLLDAVYDISVDYTDPANNAKAEDSVSDSVIDHVEPDVNRIKIEYRKSAIDEFLEVITLGFYNPSVTVRFTAYDESAGIESFTWSYTKQAGASTVNHPETLPLDSIDATVSAIQDNDDKSKYTAEITLTAEEVTQLRGYISVVATDKYGNESDQKKDTGNIIVVDNVSPKISIVYPVEANRVDANNKINYYNKDIQVKFIVTEANFYPEEMQVTITKDGQPIDFDTNDITWGERDSEDKTIGTFTLAAPADHSMDGDYVITVNYEDRSSNVMETDEKKTTYVSETYTIDTVKPVIEVNYDNKEVVNTLKDSGGHDREYYKADQTAEISITEHNFNAEDVELIVEAVDVTGQNVTVKNYLKYAKIKENWVQNGDTYTLKTEGMLFDVDANYTLSITYTDMATNETDYERVDYFTVDKTAPELVSVKYRKSAINEFLEVITLGFYQAPVEVELVVSDNTSEVREFDYKCIVTDKASAVNKGLTGKNVEDADGVTIKKDGNKFATYFTIPEGVLTAENQFDGKIDFVATNRSGVAYSYSGNTQIIVDNIAPTAQVSYNEATNNVGDIYYYNGDINATITINEANFYAEDVKVMVSKDGGVATSVTPTWKNDSVDVHTGTFTLTEDGDYIVTITYTDKSSNPMTTYTSEQMTIDTKINAPTYTINDQAKTEVGGAYKGEAKIGFNFADQNFDTKTITLTRTRFDKVEDVTETFVKVTDNDKGGSGTFTIPTEVGNDGIYVLKITMTDKAKHETESEIKFTINRFGSVYEYSDELVSLIKDGGQYIKSADNDLVITEYNADRILEGSLQILITRDGETVDVDFTSNPENINSQVGIGESGWYQYVYTIKASNFEKDGVYKISLTSKYAADDSPENESTSVPENSIDEQGKAILDTMNFTVDSVAPEIRNIVNLEESIINAQTVDVKYTIVDVGGLKSIEVILNGKTIDTITEFGDSVYNYAGQFTINESSDAQTIQIKVTDLAGNVTDTASEDFSTKDLYVFNDRVTISTNIFVRWYANKALFWGSIGGVVVLAAAVCFIVVAKKKKKEEGK